MTKQAPSKPPVNPSKPGQPAPGPGPKPGGPTRPTPTGPGQPTPAGPPTPTTHALPYGALLQHHLPGLDQLVSDASNDLARALATLRRQYDPTSVPTVEAWPGGATEADVHLAAATVTIRMALAELAHLSTLGADRAVMFSARRDATGAGAPGGPSDHPEPTPGERLSPGYAADLERPASESDVLGTASQAMNSCLGVPPCSGAGPSSDPRPVARSVSPNGHGQLAGVGPDERPPMPAVAAGAAYIDALVIRWPRW